MLQTVCSTQAGIHALLDRRPDRLLSSLEKLNMIVCKDKFSLKKIICFDTGSSALIQKIN